MAKYAYTPLRYDTRARLDAAKTPTYRTYDELINYLLDTAPAAPALVAVGSSCAAADPVATVPVASQQQQPGLNRQQRRQQAKKQGKRGGKR